MCSADGFCWEHPLPSGRMVRAAWPVSESEAWFGGTGITRINGEERTYYSLTVGVGESARPGGVSRIWGASADEVWAVGDAAWRWDGHSWTHMFDINSASHFYDVWGVGGDLWVVGAPGAWRFRQGVWTPMLDPQEPLSAVWAAAEDDVWVGGALGKLLRFDGSEWSLVASGTTGSVDAIWGASADDVWIASITEPGTVHRLVDGSFEPVQLGLPLAVHKLAGTATDDVFLVGATGVARFGGESFEEIALPYVQPFDVRAHDDQVVAAASGSRRLRFDGTGFETFPDGSEVLWPLTSVAVTGEGSTLEAWATANTALVRRDAEGVWGEVSLPTEAVHFSVYAAAPGKVWVAGSRLGKLADGSWAFVTPTGLPAYAVCGTSETDVWAVGDRIFHDDGDGFVSLPYVPRLTLERASCTGPGELWATARAPAGEPEGMIIERRGDGFAERSYSSLNDVKVRRAVALSPDEAFVVAADEGFAPRSALVRRAGKGFFGYTPDARTGLAVAAGASDEVWLVGTAGRAARFDGSTFHSVPVPTTEDIRAVYAKPGVAYAMPEDGAVFQRDGEGWTEIAPAHGFREAWSHLYVAAADDIWATASGGLLRHFDGEGWSAPAGAPASAAALSALAPDRLFAVERNGTLSLYDGEGWTSLGKASGVPTTATYVEVSACADDVAFAVTSRGHVVRSDGGEPVLEVFLDLSNSDGAALFCGGPDDVWVVGGGDPARFFRRAADGSWSAVQTLTDPVALGRDEAGLIAIDTAGALWREEDGGFVHTGPDGPPVVARATFVDGALYVPHVGAVHRFDGVDWTTLAADAPEGLAGVGVSADGHIFVVGPSGLIQHRSP